MFATEPEGGGFTLTHLQHVAITHVDVGIECCRQLNGVGKRHLGGGRGNGMLQFVSRWVSQRRGNVSCEKGTAIETKSLTGCLLSARQNCYRLSIDVCL